MSTTISSYKKKFVAKRGIEQVRTTYLIWWRTPLPCCKYNILLIPCKQPAVKSRRQAGKANQVLVIARLLVYKKTLWAHGSRSTRWQVLFFCEKGERDTDYSKTRLHSFAINDTLRRNLHTPHSWMCPTWLGPLESTTLTVCHLLPKGFFFRATGSG